MAVTDSVVQLVVSQLIDAVASHLHSHRTLEENVTILMNKIEVLKCVESDVKEKLNSAEVLYGKEPKREVNLWLKNVQEIVEEAIQIEEDFKGQGTQFLLLRGDLGKLVEKKIRQAVELKKNSRFFNGLFADILPDSGRIPTRRLVGERNFKKIWKSLLDVGVGIIGIYGIEGVGKTTVMAHIHNMLKDVCIFDSVIWVTVSRATNIERLQKDIAKEIGLELREEDNEMRKAMKLFQALTRMKKFVLILDDMWEAFPLERIGIPEPNVDNGCKLVLTTRCEGLCIDMDCQRGLKVELLSKEDAFELLKEKLGSDVEVTPEVETFVRGVSEECGGLPLRIIQFAREMRKNSRRERSMMEREIVSKWKFVYDKLKYSTTTQQQSRKISLGPLLLEDEEEEKRGIKRKALELPTVASTSRRGSSSLMIPEDQNGCGMKKGHKQLYVASNSRSLGSPPNGFPLSLSIFPTSTCPECCVSDDSR
ncbi:probable disease resistance protein At1g52660 [Magnolia sinica]|uniref:probable disease resistance protein At1g52660 n=1 Tax=Magnolia sinica TaxID=86752 RepID=UPI0026588493|nr:probable disease resistance protein At1g52660 [Magnolia sinica]XP_058073184.1 probable disease resistance protein At1g52660 [Magnolia sinica]